MVVATGSTQPGGAEAPRTRTPDPILVGRADHVETVRRLIAAARVVTVVGPPGMGKSAIARQVAQASPASALAEIAGLTERGAVVRIAHSVDQGGYWLVTSRGNVYRFGDAGWYGSMAARRLWAPVVRGSAVSAIPSA